jgi:hypothetical protein
LGIVRGAILTLLSLGFLTIGPVVRGDPWRFVITGDSRGSTTPINAPILAEIAGEIVRRQPAVVLFTGDLVRGRSQPEPIPDQYDQWLQVMRPVYDAGIRVLACRGNHDTYWPTFFQSDQYPLQKLPDNGPPGETFMTYSATHENAIFIAMDHFGGTLTQPIHRVNLPWLESTLAANQRPHIFVFGHEPAFKVYHPDCLDDNRKDRDLFWQTLTRYGARVNLCAHDHFYNRARIDDGDGDPVNDLTQIIVGTAGAPLYQPPKYDGDNGIYKPIKQFHAMEFGYIVVDVNDLDVQMTWMQRDDAALGKGTYSAADAWGYRAKAQPVAFPDANLRQAVAAQLGIERPTPEQMLGLTELSASASQIRELEGLEYARNLRTADLRDNLIESIDALSGLNQLVLLDLLGNPLSDQARCREVVALRTLNPAAEIRIDPPSRSLVSDCAADYRDLDILSQVWGQGCLPGDGLCTLSDLDGSGAVDLEDLLVLAEYWLGTP